MARVVGTKKYTWGVVVSAAKRGFFPLIKSVVVESVRVLHTHYLTLYYSLLQPKTFFFEERNMPYFYSSKNATYSNERCIEIAVGKYYLNKYKDKKILEVGNVLARYFPVYYDVLDKYDKNKNTISADVETYKSTKKYDLIITISTMEHVGFDETDKRVDKIPKSIANLKSQLAKNGELIITVPFGYNPHLDKYIRTKPFSRAYYFSKQGQNDWKAIESLPRPPKPSAKINYLVVGIIS